MAITSQYNPFTFEEMLAAVNIADSQHKALEDQLGVLASEASIWESLANNEKDMAAYNQYKQYATDLEAQVNDLAKAGLNPRSKQAFNTMRTRYGAEIMPIQNAYNTRQKWIEEQRDYLAKTGGNARFTLNAENVGLGELMNNPSMTYSALSGDAIAKASADMAQTFQNEISNPNSQYSVILRGVFGPAKYQRLIQNGLSMDEVMKTIQGSPEGNAVLQEMINSAVSQFGYNDIQDQGIRDWMIDNANRGAYQAVGKTSIDYSNSPDYAWRQDVDLINRRAAASGGSSGGGNQSMSQYIPNYSRNEVLNVNAKIKTTKLNEENGIIQKAIDAIRSGDRSMFSDVNNRANNYLPQSSFGVTIPGNAMSSNNYTPGFAAMFGGEKGLLPNTDGNKIKAILRNNGFDIDPAKAPAEELINALSSSFANNEEQIRQSAIINQTYSPRLDESGWNKLATILQREKTSRDAISGDNSLTLFKAGMDKQYNKNKSEKKLKDFEFKGDSGSLVFTGDENNNMIPLWTTEIDGDPVLIDLRKIMPSDLNDPNVGDINALNEMVNLSLKNKNLMNYRLPVYDPKTKQTYIVNKTGYEAQALIDNYMNSLTNRMFTIQFPGGTNSDASQISFANGYRQ